MGSMLITGCLRGSTPCFLESPRLPSLSFLVLRQPPAANTGDVGISSAKVSLLASLRTWPADVLMLLIAHVLSISNARIESRSHRIETGPVQFVCGRHSTSNIYVYINGDWLQRRSDAAHSEGGLESIYSGASRAY